MISRFMAAAAAGESVTVYGDGEQTRDFVYVGDVVEAIASRRCGGRCAASPSSTWHRASRPACCGVLGVARDARRAAPRARARARAERATSAHSRADTGARAVGARLGRRGPLDRASPRLGMVRATWEWYAEAAVS